MAAAKTFMNPTESITDFISVSEIRERYLPEVSSRWITEMCKRGVFPSAKKPGYGTNAHWRVIRAEVINHVLQNRNQILAQESH